MRKCINVTLIFLLLTRYGSTENANCEVNVDISDGTRRGTNITKDGVVYSENDYFQSGDQVLGCICNVKHCIRKCCSENEVLNLTSKHCIASPDEPVSSTILQHIIHVPDNRICNDVQVKINIGTDFATIDGVLVWDDLYFAKEDFCLSFQKQGTFAIACIKPEGSSIATWATSIGMIISMPFLALTFLVYLILPDKNLHRKALMFYVLSLLLGYISLVSIQLHEGQIVEALCHILGYCIIFFFLTSFFWMNVMCIDMWLAFSGSRGFMGKRDFERTRFIFYCLYAWGMPILHILIVYLLNTYGDKTSWYHPLMGDKKCFLDDGMPNLLYFYGPIGILTGVNIILFILTTVKIQRVKRETKMLKHSDSRKHSYEDDKQKYILYLKLFFVMGVNWTMEVISWAFLWQMHQVPPAVWYSTDFANAIYGVFIFAIFVCKKKIWNSLKRRYYVFIGKPHLAQAVTTSQTTRTSHFSTTDSGTNHDQRLQELRNARGEQRALTME